MKTYRIRLSWPEWVDYDHFVEAKNEKEAITLAKMQIAEDRTSGEE